LQLDDRALLQTMEAVIQKGVRDAGDLGVSGRSARLVTAAPPRFPALAK